MNHGLPISMLSVDGVPIVGGTFIRVPMREAIPCPVGCVPCAGMTTAAVIPAVTTGTIPAIIMTPIPIGVAVTGTNTVPIAVHISIPVPVMDLPTRNGQAAAGMITAGIVMN